MRAAWVQKMSKFIVVIPNSSIQQVMIVKNLFPPQKAGWWHHSNDVWLLYFSQGGHTVQSVYNDLQRVLPGVGMLVFKVEEGAPWIGWGPDGWKKWFAQYWP
jgi:hypothetical protein